MDFPNDHREWEQLTESLRQIEGLTPFEVEDAAHAFSYLSQTLGPDFLKEISGKRHPLEWLVINFAPWTRRRIIRFAESLQAVSSSRNFDSLLRSLHNSDKFAHNELMIDFTARLAREGFAASFEPTLPVSNNRKQPDVRLEHAGTNETLFMEVSLQQPSREESEAHEAMNQLTSLFMRIGTGLRWAGRMFKTPAAPHLFDIVVRLNTAIERAQSEKRFLEFIDEGTCEIAFCPSDTSELLDSWCLMRGLQPGGFQGPPYNDNATERLKFKLAKEQSQLPHDFPNVILVGNSDIFFRVRDVRLLLSNLEEEVFKYPHVAIVIVRGEHLCGFPPDVIQKGEHRYIRRSVDEMATEESLVLLNRYSPKPVSASVISKILRIV